MKLIDKLRAIRVGLIDDAGRFYKLASFWVFVLIGAAPDIYNGIAAMGWFDQVPERFAWILRSMAAAGIVVRVLKQRAPGADDKAGA